MHPARPLARGLAAGLLLAAVGGALPAPAAPMTDPTPDPTATPRAGGTAPLDLPAGVRYFSAPPRRTAPAAAERRAADPAPAPTRGTVTGRVLDPAGRPLANRLVQGIRYSDLGRGINYFDEVAVVARTGADGRFRLPQLTERYLVRICEDPDGNDQCAYDRNRTRYATLYVGPDGTSRSWTQQTRLYAPKAAGRNVGTVRVRPYAVLTGTFAGGADRTFRLLRGDGSTATTVQTDGRGRYTTKVAPGRYRVEADRQEGLKTASTVIGYRSGELRLTTAHPTRLDFGTRPAATVAGRFVVADEPAADQLLVITDERGRWAAGVLTDERGAYRVDALRPGRYTVQNPGNLSDAEPVRRTVTARRGRVTTADLTTDRGGQISFEVSDPGGNGEVNAELRDARGSLVQEWAGTPSATEAGEARIPGLQPGTYQLVVRRALQDLYGAPQREWPWTERTVTVPADGKVDLGRLALDRATLTVSGRLPRGTQVKITTLPVEPYLRDDFVNAPLATSLTVGLTEQAGPDGRYTSYGAVPGRYLTVVSTALVEPIGERSRTGANVAVTRGTLTVGDRSVVRDLSAPAGGIVSGRFGYAGSRRPLIAPIGYAVRDGQRSYELFPTVTAEQQRYGGRFRVDRLHAGRVRGSLLDLTEVQALRGQWSALPEVFIDNALIAEEGTPWWFEARTRTVRVRPGQVTDLGRVGVTLRG